MTATSTTGQSLLLTYAICGLLSALVITVGYVASHRTADAACTVDPPDVVMPEHRSRSLELGLDGWDCVLAVDGAEVARVRLGWWPDDPIAVWAQLAAQAPPRSTGAPAPGLLTGHPT